MSLRTALIVAACVTAGVAGLALRAYHDRNRNDAAREQAALAKLAPHLEEGDPVPTDLRLVDLQGQAHRLEDYRGKLVVVNFWATWCAPCLHEIPTLVAAQDKYGGRGLQVLGPAVDEEADVRTQAPGLKFNYPVFVAPSADMLSLLTRFGDVQGGLPYSVVISPKGRIVDRQLGEFSAVELAALIEHHLGRKP